MITRIFTVRIEPTLRDEFERDFQTISIASVENKEGFIDCQISGSTVWNPNTYAMISHWQTEASLERFAGKNWNTAVIPKGMEGYVVACQVEHFDSRTFDQ